LAGFQTVSPTCASRIDLSPVTIYPIEPFSILLSEIYFGEKYQTSSASIFL
jgi:hypothetical protein